MTNVWYTLSSHIPQNVATQDCKHRPAVDAWADVYLQSNCSASVLITPRIGKTNEANVNITRKIMLMGKFCSHTGLILFKRLKENRNENYFLSVPAYLPI